MDLQDRILQFQIKNKIRTKQELSDYLRISRPLLNKIISGQKITEFSAWKVFLSADGYVCFEELVHEVSEKYLKRMQRKNAKILIDKHLRIMLNARRSTLARESTTIIKK